MANVCILLACTVIHLATASLENVAVRKPASSSSIKPGYTASEAVDGNTDAGIWIGDTIIDTGYGYPFAWWKVDLQSEVQDATVRIYFRTDYKWRRNGVKLYTSTSPFPESNPTSQGQLCDTVTGDPSGSDIPDVYNVTCPGRWRYLLLYTDTDNENNGQSTGPILDFGEVEVLFAESCSNGLYGDACTKLCDSRHCLNMPTTCDKDGTCPNGCQNGWTGLDCTVLPPCPDNNNYSLDCDKLCSDRKCKVPSTSSCDRLTGRCPDGCDAGWREEDCTQACDPGSYGASCASTCSTRHCLSVSSSCDHVTGQCDGGCQPGYKEPDCVYACDSGYYGPDCSSLCSDRKCMDSSTECNHVTGQCHITDGQYRCTAGYKGIDCLTKCDSGTYGPDCSLVCSDRKCSDQSSQCDHVTGQCEGGCLAGYQGTDCRQACDQDVNYGVNCAKSCSARHCNQPSSVCNTETGQCIGGCMDGWTGVDCKSQCPAGTFGSDCTSCSTRHCQGESDCPADGTCSQGCQDGWTGHTCSQECLRGMYGPGCSMTCGNCSSDYACHHVTGNCPRDCKPGWRTEKCNAVCLDGTYGPDCTEKCGECDGVCDSVDGRCPAGCLDGFCGTKCDVDLGASGNFGVSSLVGAVVGTFLVVVLLGVGIHICLIRQGRLQWIKHLEDSKPVQGSRDFNQMGSIVTRPADVSEHAQSSNNAPINDYAELDSGTIRGNKDYEVIQTKHYENL